MSTFDDLLTTIPTPETIDERVRERKAEAKRKREEQDAADRDAVIKSCKQHRVAIVRDMTYALADAIVRIAPEATHEFPCSLGWPNAEVCTTRILHDEIVKMFHEDVAPLFARRGWVVSVQQTHTSGMSIGVKRCPA